MAAERFERLEGQEWYIRDPQFAAIAYSDCLELAKDVFASVAQTHTGSLIHFLGRYRTNDALLKCLHLIIPIEFYQKAMSILLSRLLQINSSSRSTYFHPYLAVHLPLQINA